MNAVDIHNPLRAKRDVRLDLLRMIAILECVVAHALMADYTNLHEYLWIMMFVPDVGGIFFMASGAIILERNIRKAEAWKPVSWRYVWRRISTFLPEFILFSLLYAVLDWHCGYQSDQTTLTRRILYMLVTPTWGPGWFILTLIGLYLVLPILSSWIKTASKRQIEIGLAIWIAGTLLPFFMSQTEVHVEQSAFATIYNYAGYMLIGYYLVHWPLKQRSMRFKTAFFIITPLVGIVFGYFLGKSGLKWDYIDYLVIGLSITEMMLALFVFGLALMMPERWFTGKWARVITWMSLMSLGIYCSHWLVIRYWAIPEGINWVVGSAVTLAFSVPTAYVMYLIRRSLTKRKV